MRKTKKAKFNKKINKKFDNNIREKLIKLLFMITAICLIVFSISGCINQAQRQAKEFVTPGEATMTIIEHDILGNKDSYGNNGSNNSLDGGESITPESFVENRIDNIPYYYISIHNGTGSKPVSEKNITESFNYLEEMIQKADEYAIKLTLIFSAQWAAYISENPGRVAILDGWMESGHQIVYDTGFGFPSFIESEDPGYIDILLETSPEKGINEFILTGIVNGAERKWLKLYQITNKKFLNQAIKTFEKLDSRVVYGVAAQSVKEQTPLFYAYLDYLHSLDPEGLNSKTLKSIIEKKLIPEKIMPEEVLNLQYK